MQKNRSGKDGMQVNRTNGMCICKLLTIIPSTQVIDQDETTDFLNQVGIGARKL
uniref:Uncharacterized protein n=1 Tax=Picea sitchensis TaxID=3332 RepID=D5AEC3_PICSI|nr:unknown [Picea sitchensis]